MDSIFVYIAPSEAWLFIFANYGAETSIFADSCFSSSYNKNDCFDSLLETTTLTIIDQVALDIEILPKIRNDLFNSQFNNINTYLFKITLQHNILVNNYYYSLMYQLYPGF